MTDRRIHLAGFLIAGNTAHSHAIWRHPASEPGFLTAGYYQEIARSLERGLFDLVFFADRLAMYEFVATRLRRAVPELSLCKEEFDVQTLLYARLGITKQACNCLSASVPMVAPDGRRHLPLIGERP